MEWGSDSCGGTVNTQREGERENKKREGKREEGRERDNNNNNLVGNRMRRTDGKGMLGHHNTAGKSTALAGENANTRRTKTTGVAQCSSLL